jgi:hypothetical protein
MNSSVDNNLSFQELTYLPEESPFIWNATDSEFTIHNNDQTFVDITTTDIVLENNAFKRSIVAQSPILFATCGNSGFSTDNGVTWNTNVTYDHNPDLVYNAYIN